ncbi:hypothetical protein JYU34_006990 [Plutella xylostella]|uniref:Uncharacterized protein n=1 Tax=Plutella xylostella TaxID=51655 RepID=A0ABQ7QTE8_PLUXY|nr:hypothetical protein JYU34_006990 [Plutella xylostella]
MSGVSMHDSELISLHHKSRNSQAHGSLHKTSGQADISRFYCSHGGCNGETWELQVASLGGCGWI